MLREQNCNLSVSTTQPVPLPTLEIGSTIWVFSHFSLFCLPYTVLLNYSPSNYVALEENSVAPRCLLLFFQSHKITTLYLNMSLSGKCCYISHSKDVNNKLDTLHTVDTVKWLYTRRPCRVREATEKRGGKEGQMKWKGVAVELYISRMDTKTTFKYKIISDFWYRSSVN